MNKKIFVWAMTLAMIVSLLPVPAMHNHAHAVEYDCAKGCGAAGKCDHIWAAHIDVCFMCFHKKVEITHVHDYFVSASYEATCMERAHNRIKCTGCEDAYTEYLGELDPDNHYFVNGFCLNLDRYQNQCTAHLHKWQDGVCITVEDCDALHDHVMPNDFTLVPGSYVAGNCVEAGTALFECYICGAQVEEKGSVNVNGHDWVNGVCQNGCNTKCVGHSWENSVCTNCKLVCLDHAWDDNHVCTVCGVSCVHEWTNGICSECGLVCEHPFWTNGDCNVCDAVCTEHVWNEKGSCSVCRFACVHIWGNGSCTVCSLICSHSWEGNSCTICTFVCAHEHTTDEIIEKPTCNKKGTANEICDLCGIIVQENKSLPKDTKAHNWTAMGGGFAWLCLDCGDVSAEHPGLNKDDDDPDAPACTHEKTYEFVITTPTCVKPGSYIDVCSACGEAVSEAKSLDIDIDAHNWENGVCQNNCGADCNHNWEKGHCTICKTTCDHNWEKGVCLNGCGYECTHIAWKDSVCYVCGADCNHNWEKDHCTICKTTCDHNWEKGVCLNGCGYECTHIAWKDSVCYVCGADCNHNWENGNCTLCKKVCEHEWEDGVCGVCSTVCAHDDVTEEVIEAATCKKEGSATVTCDICGDVETKVLPVDKEDGHDWIVFSFGGWICSRCNEMTIDNPTDEPDPTPVLPQPSNPCPDDEHKWIVFSFGGWVCEKCFMMTNENPTDEPDPTPALPEVTDPCPVDEHDWIEFSFGGWVCNKCGTMTNENPIQPEYRDGDVNGDSAVDGRDVIRLMKYLVGGASIVESAADVNDDGAIDGRDVIRLMKKVL